MKYWFTADTHFSHQRTLELSKRPFVSVSAMNNEMVTQWNSVVNKEDTVFHLGDFGDYGYSSLLNGKIILLFGNYERSDIEKGIVTLDQLESGYNFKEVHDGNKIHFSYQDIKMNMVHEPSHMSEIGFNLFGHIHKLQMVKRNGLNVGVDCHNFTPIDLDTVKFYKNAIENHYDEEVFM